MFMHIIIGDLTAPCEGLENNKIQHQGELIGLNQMSSLALLDIANLSNCTCIQKNVKTDRTVKPMLL